MKKSSMHLPVVQNAGLLPNSRYSLLSRLHVNWDKQQILTRRLQVHFRAQLDLAVCKHTVTLFAVYIFPPIRHFLLFIHIPINIK